MTVLIDCRSTSQLDGKFGKYIGMESGLHAVLVDGFRYPMLFHADELQRIN